MIGWRGEPGSHDIKQHIASGKILSSLLTDLGISFEVMPQNFDQEAIEDILRLAAHNLKERKIPFAILVKRETLAEQKGLSQESSESAEESGEKDEISTEACIEFILKNLGEYDCVLSTSGIISKKIYQFRDLSGQTHEKDFLIEEARGVSPGVSLGISQVKKTRKIYCIDGDGTLLMQLGILADIGNYKLKNFRHIVLNNGKHGSLGNFRTAAANIDLYKIAAGCGYQHTTVVRNQSDLKEKFGDFARSEGPCFMEIKVPQAQ